MDHPPQARLGGAARLARSSAVYKPRSVSKYVPLQLPSGVSAKYEGASLAKEIDAKGVVQASPISRSCMYTRVRTYSSTTWGPQLHTGLPPPQVLHERLVATKTELMGKEAARADLESGRAVHFLCKVGLGGGSLSSGGGDWLIL